MSEKEVKTVNVFENVHEELKMYCKQNGYVVKHISSDAIKEYLEKNGVEFDENMKEKEEGSE